MPMTVWLRHTNLYTCSACRSFEQAQHQQGRDACFPVAPPVATDALSSPGMMDMGVAVLSLKVVTAAGPRNWACRLSLAVPAMLQPVEMLRVGLGHRFLRVECVLSSDDPIRPN